MVSFGRRSKGRSPLSWRIKGKPHAGLEPVASEERSALLSGAGPPNVEPSTGPRSREASSVKLGPRDPSQRLLTILDRFQNQVTKAVGGAPQEEWSDECMNQLIAAVEIAMAHGWTEVVKSLTETGRILQTYEDAHEAAGCVPFLSKCYEILVLMAQDLMVGEVRRSLVRQWAELSDQAFEELQIAGLTLVSDEDERGMTENQPFLSPNAKAGSPFEAPALKPTDAPSLDDALPTLDDLPPLEDELIGQASPSFDPAMRPLAEDDALPSPTPPTSPGEDESALEELEPLAPLGDVAEPPAEVEELASVETPEPAVEASPATHEQRETSAEPQPFIGMGLDAEIANILDGLCDKLARLEAAEPGDRTALFEAIQEDVDTLETEASHRGYAGARNLCGRMRALCSLAQQQGDPLRDGFFDLAYAFGGAYAEAGTSPEEPVVADWCVECQAVVGRWGEEPPPAEEPEPLEDESAEGLLETAQRLMAQGNVAQAKSLALQAAATIAKLEAHRAKARVEETEIRLREGAGAIKAALANVEAAEREVTEVESKIAESQAVLAQLRDESEAVGKQIAESESRIADLDDEIRKLQEARAREEERLGETKAVLDAQRQKETQAQAELDEQADVEKTTRKRLEDTRQNVKNLQRKRSELESELGNARDDLSLQELSLAGIEQTIAHQIRRVTGNDTAGAELPF